jgi:hypothetical protein
MMIAVLLVATYLRVHELAQWPPGLAHDEAINGLDAVRIVRTGTLPTYRVDGRPEPLFRYVQALTVGLLGPTRFGLRMASVFTGLLGVAGAGRAARHLAPPGNITRRRYVGIVAAAMMAILVGHLTISRVGYRAILLPVGALLFLDSFLAAWKSGARRAFVWAGVWLALCLNSYTAGAAMLGALPLALAHQAIFNLPLFKRRLKGLAIFAATFTLLMIPLLVIFAVQPALYERAGELASESQPATQVERLREAGQLVSETWQSFSDRGDPNPQYNVDSAPLLHTPFLYALFLLGIAASLLRPRRLTSVLLLSLLVEFLFPVAFAGEIPHGLRITGEFAVIPLLVASGVGLLMWLASHLKRARIAAQAALALVVAGVFVQGAFLTGQLYFGYWEKDVIYQSAGVNTFSWFFRGPRVTMAEYAANQTSPVYLPVPELSRPTLRYLTLNSHPTVTTFADRLEPDGSLNLPAGMFVLPPREHLTGGYALLEPDGTLLLLPQLDAVRLAELEMARYASDVILLDQFGVPAATLVSYPPNGENIHWDSAIAYPASADYDGQVRLVGWAGPAELPAQLEGGEPFEFTLYLKPGPNQRRDLDIFAQVWTLDEESMGGVDTNIIRWLYPNSQWETGDIVPITVRFPLTEGPTELPPGGYRLAVGINDAWGERLPVLDAGGAPVGDVAYAGGLKVPDDIPPDLSGMQPVDWQVGDAIALIGYRLERGGQPVSALAPGDEATLMLAWEATGRPAADYTAFFHLEDAAGNVIAQYDVQPTDGLFPTGVWDAGEIYTSLHPVVVPPDANAGPYRLLAGMYTWPSLDRLPVKSPDGGDAPGDGRIPLLTMP